MKKSKTSAALSSDPPGGAISGDLEGHALSSLGFKSSSIGSLGLFTSSTWTTEGMTASAVALTGAASGGKVKVKSVKDKILSASSNTLNRLFRGKALPSWRMGSSSSSIHLQQNAVSTKQLEETDAVSKRRLCIPEGKEIITGMDAGAGNAAITITQLNRLGHRRSRSISGFFSKPKPHPEAKSSNSISSSVSVASSCSKAEEDGGRDVFCRLCLTKVRKDDTVEVKTCTCRYCRECLTAYVSFKIQEGAEDISCPDGKCGKLGDVSSSEVEILVPKLLFEKYRKFRLHREVEKDDNLLWCLSPGCETICRIEETTNSDAADKISLIINCKTCRQSFCAECKLNSHKDISCESFRHELIKQGKLISVNEELSSLTSIKRCPFCHIPIEKTAGCSQMKCRKCKHLFCWHCRASLDEESLFGHILKGPCKNERRPSRAALIWYRTKIIGVFAGFWILVLLASPVLLLASPLFICLRCLLNKYPK